MRIERWLYTLPLRIRSLFRRGDVERDLDDEIRDHIERQTQANVAAGMSLADARTAALREFGGVERRKDEIRETRGVSNIEQCMQDLSYAVRGLRRSSGFTIATVLTLALGIGVSSTAFSLVNRLVLHPVPFAAGDRLRFVSMNDARSDVSVAPDSRSIEAWTQHAKTIDAIALIGNDRYVVTDSTHAFTITGGDASPAVLSMLDIVPVAGRNLVAADTVAGAPRVAMLGELVWRREFGGRPDIVGHTILLNDTLVTIVGIAPAQLNALMSYQPVGVWVPVPVSVTQALARRGMFWMDVIARIRPGVTDEDARRELQDLDDRIRRDWGEPARTATSKLVRLARPSDYMGAELHAGLWIAFGATGLVLLIACANVASLQLVRTTRRAGEMAVRRALGASSARIARHFMIEGGVLTLLGTGVGVLFGYWILRAVVAMRPEQLRQLTVVRFDWAAVGFAAAAAVISSVVFAVAPAWRQGTVALADGLRLSGAHGIARRRWLQPAAVSGEIALSLILLTAAGLLVRSFVRLQDADPGYVASGLVEFSATLPRAHFPDSLARDQFWHQFLPRVRAIPGVAAVSIPAQLPGNAFLMETIGLQVEGRQLASGEDHVWLAERMYSSADFRVLQTRVVRGRLFTSQDERGETDAVIVAESAARYLWPGESAIGKRLRQNANAPWLTVAGVIADQGAVTEPVRGEPGLQIFLPASETRLHERRGLLVRVAAGANAEAVIANMASALHTMDRTIPITLAKSEVAIIHDAQAQPRFVAMILTVFAVLALFLACFGLYGVISFAVTQRVREIGVRMALGAESTDVIRLVLGSGARLALLGAIVGVIASVAASRVMRGVLYGVSPLDPLVYAAMPVLLMAVALFATYLPARRAARADPVIALRAE